MDTIADRIRWILEQRELSARALSKKAGLAEGHVGLILRGTVGDGVAASTLNKIAIAGDVNPHWLITGEGAREPLSGDVDVPPPDEHHGAREEMPETLGQRKDYARQEAAAKKKLANDGEVIEEWVWPHVRAANNFTLSNSPPSVAMLCEVAKLIAAHGDPSVKPLKKS